MRALVLLLLAALAAAPTRAEDALSVSAAGGGRITVVVREAPLAEVFEMLAREQRVNVLLGDQVEGEVSVNLFEVSLDQAIRSIAEAAGYVAERRRGAYMVLKREELGQDAVGDNTIVRSFKIQYSDPELSEEIVEKYLSRYGQVTVLPERRILVVEDQPEFVERIGRVLAEVDREPRQVLIDAKILEVSLQDDEVFGIDWSRVFKSGGDTITVGVRGFADPLTPGLFLDVMGDDLEVALNALSDKGRVRTLSTPTLLALEHQEAEVVIGDRLGFRVTTTINEVTTESVEFLESGVILRVTASVDRDGRILLQIHPEVSTGVIVDGLPSQNTTEVTTNLLVEDGEKIFIGGLLKDRSSETRSGVPWLSDIPWLGRLFARNQHIVVATETVVVATARVMDGDRRRITLERSRHIPSVEDYMERQRDRIDAAMDYRFRDAYFGGDASSSDADDDEPGSDPAEPSGEVPAAEAGSD